MNKIEDFLTTPPDGYSNTKWGTVEQRLQHQYDFVFNVITGRLLYSPLHPENRERKYFDLTDRVVARIRRSLALDGFPANADLVQSCISAMARDYNPITEYFNSLPAWDKKGDYIAETAAQVEVAEEHQKIWYTYFTKWIVGGVATAIDNRANSGILTLKGEQNIGKTRWLSSLFPPELKQYCSSSETITHDNKDARIMVAEKMIVILDELESSTRQDMSFLKSLLTVENVSVRRPYGTHAETLNRICSFAASVNSDEFLHDHTGNRRFWVVEAINIELFGIDTQQLYAQALELYRDGYRYWFDTDETQVLARFNSAFEVTTPEMDAVVRWFVPVNADESTAQFLSGGQILERLKIKTGNSKLNHQKLGQALKKLNFRRISKRINKHPIYVWICHEIH